jgi:hypothetical protein
VEIGRRTAGKPAEDTPALGLPLILFQVAWQTVVHIGRRLPDPPYRDDLLFAGPVALHSVPEATQSFPPKQISVKYLELVVS